MTVKLIIAGIKWNCKVPDAILSESILSFAADFAGNEDINLEIRYADIFEEPKGKSITNEVLDWYIDQQGKFSYHMVKRDENSGEILASMKINNLWSDVLIEAKYGNEIAIYTINILLTEIVFRNRIQYYNGLVIHSSAVEHEGETLLFSAPSGVGKSTHAGLWQKHCNATVINDDHPAVRIISGKPIVFGTPWAGEAKKFSNRSSVLKGIVVLEQGAVNTIRPMNSKEILREFFPRIFLPYYNTEMVDRALAVFNEIINQVMVYKLTCRPDKEAVMLVKKHIFD